MSKLSCQDSGPRELSTNQDHFCLKLMESSSKDSGEGSYPEAWSQQSMETQIIMCVKEIQSFQGVARKSKIWYKDYGFEDMDKAKTLGGKWTRCPAISWTLGLSMLNTLYKEIRCKPPCPYHGQFCNDLYHFMSEVFWFWFVSFCDVSVHKGLRPRRLINLNEVFDLLDCCYLAFQDSSPVSSSFAKVNLKIIGAMKRVAYHTAQERCMMDDSQVNPYNN
jgi:hypothetical protein